jgi:hypothetical protein
VCFKCRNFDEVGYDFALAASVQRVCGFCWSRDEGTRFS